MHAFDPRRGLMTYRRIRRGGNFGVSPPTLLASGFLALILLGTLMLALPIAAASQRLSIFEALFTATAAVTVSGMAVVDLGDLSLFGQWVVLILVQIGGLGFVTFAVVSAITLGQRMSLRQQSLALEAFNQTNSARLSSTAMSVLRITVTIELTATVLLFVWWWASGRLPPASALYHAFFHSVAAFNNSGYTLFERGLAEYLGDGVTIATLSSVVILGGIGFPVIAEIMRKKRWRGFSPYVKLILLAALLLNLAGFAGIWLLEAQNPATLGALPWPDQARAAWMQSVSLRTAGFSAIDMRAMDDSTTLLSIILMFIGGGSMSTAGGIKLGTFIVILAAVYAFVTHRKEVILLRRTVAPDTVQKALAVVVVTILTAVTGLMLLTILEDLPFIGLLTEVIAALSTTGLSHGLTPELTIPGQCVILILMFMGRVGPLTLVYSLATRTRSRVRYPDMEFQVG